jgi:Domain of unknown function (DUF4114)
MELLPFSGQIFEITPSNVEPLIIASFDRTQDVIAIEAGQRNYRIEAVDGGLNISDDSKLLAVITGEADIQRLTPYTYLDDTGRLYFVDSTNPALATAIESSFFAPYYPIQNSDIDALIAAGEYTSYFDHFIKAGQFENREDNFFGGTASNDLVTGFGDESIVTGVSIVYASYLEGVDILPGTTGVGEQDTLIGGSGATIFQLGNGTKLNSAAKTFYVGQGEQDYALIKNFNSAVEGDRLLLPGLPKDYTFELVDGSTRVLKSGDLVAVVEGISKIIPTNREIDLTSFHGTDDPYYGRDLKPFFLESAYFSANPDAKVAVDASTYASGLDHFLNVGLEKGTIGVYSGTTGNDSYLPVGKTVSFGVPVTEIDSKALTFKTGSTGVGEADVVYGSAAEDIFVLGNPGTKQAFYVGQGDTDFLSINGFNIQLDQILLAGKAEDYIIESDPDPDNSSANYTKISTKGGDLIATIRGEVPWTNANAIELKSIITSSSRDGFYLTSFDNQAFNDNYKPYFFEPLYFKQNPDVAALITSGQFTSAYDHFIRAGQFEEREDTLFQGTSGNDTLNGLGHESILVGVPISDAQYQGGFDIVPITTGNGEIDTLIGSTGENIFALGNGISLNSKSQSFYTGQGDADYALVQGFDSTIDFLILAGVASDYAYDRVDGNLRISLNGDLVAIVENAPALVAYPQGGGVFYVAGTQHVDVAQYYKPTFNSDFYLSQNPAARDEIINGRYASAFDYYINNEGQLGSNNTRFTLWDGTDQRDFLGGFGAAYGVIGAKVTSFETKDGLPTSLTTAGAGKRDSLYGGAGSNIIYLGTLGKDPKAFYIGDGEADFATVINFDPKQDYISLANTANPEILPHFSFQDLYTIEKTDKETRILTKAGDLVAKVEGSPDLVPFTGPTPTGAIHLVSLENEFFSKYIEPSFFEAWYLEFDKSDYGDSVQKAIDAGTVKTAYEHYLKFGQFEAREDSLFTPKTDGNNILYGSGYEVGLVGVPISAGVYTRDVTPTTTGVGEVDTLVGAAGEDTFFLGNAAIINDKAQPFYVGNGDQDYALIKNFGRGTTFGNQVPDLPVGTREALTDRIILAGKHYDYTFQKVASDLKISFKGDLIAIIEDAPQIDITFPIPGATYVYTVGNVGTFDAISGFGTENTLYQPLYLENNPGIEKLVADGAYKSVFDHFVQVGQLSSTSTAAFSGTSGDDFLTGTGAASLLFGTEVTLFDSKTGGYRTKTNGSGEADAAVGGLGQDTFYIGNDNVLDQGKAGEVWYLGKGDDDYLTIQGFDPYKDSLSGTGEFADYSFEVIAEVSDVFGRQVPYKSLEVSYKGDRVALLKYIDGSLTTGDITRLQALPTNSERPNAITLVAAVNELLPPINENLIVTASVAFNNKVYLATNPIARLEITNGAFSTGIGYYNSIGQSTAAAGIFTGKGANDTVTGYGAITDLYGVDIDSSGEFTTDATGKLIGTVTLTSRSNGEIDTLVGNAASKDRFHLGFATESTVNADGTVIGKSRSLYGTKGNIDFANIQSFQTGDEVILAGAARDYIFKSRGGNFEIYNSASDLLGIVNGASELQVGSYSATTNITTLVSGALPGGFDEDYYSRRFPDNVTPLIENGTLKSGLEHYTTLGQYHVPTGSGPKYQSFVTGTSSNDILIGFGEFEVDFWGVGINFIQEKPERRREYESLGVGEIDTFVGAPGIINEFILTTQKDLLNAEAKTLYIGQRDNDYALIQNFAKSTKGEIVLAGNPADYVFAQAGADVRISLAGDLVAIVENIKVADLSNFKVSAAENIFEIIFYNAPGTRNFDEALYRGAYVEVDKLVIEGKNTSGLDFYDRVGQYPATRREAFFTGGSDNNTITGFGDDVDLYGIGYAVAVKDDTIVTLTPTSLGVGEIDNLLGRNDPNLEDGFFLSALTGDHSRGGVNNPTVGSTTQLYVGNGDQDYGLIKNFNAPRDYVSLAGKPSDYEYRSEGGDFKILTKAGDLVGIVENAVELKARRFLADGSFRLAGRAALQQGFNSDWYNLNTPVATAAIAAGNSIDGLNYYAQFGQAATTGYFSGTFDATTSDQKTLNDTVFGFGKSNVIAGVGIRVATAADGTKTVDIRTTGQNELDVLVGDKGTKNEFVLGLGSQVFYIGGKEKDFANIENFRLGEDSLRLAGSFTDYVMQEVSGNTEISTNGDLVAVVRGINSKYLKPSISDAASGTFMIIGDITPTQDFAVSDGLIDINIQDDQNIRVNLTNPTSSALFSNTVGFYRVQDSIGTVIDPADSKSYKPGDVGYALAAVRVSQVANSGVSFGIKSGNTPSVDLVGGYFYAPFLIVDSTVDKLLNATASNVPEVFFQFGAANSDGIVHTKILDANTIGFEDQKGGGDLDFNDAIFKVNTALII